MHSARQWAFLAAVVLAVVASFSLLILPFSASEGSTVELEANGGGDDTVAIVRSSSNETLLQSEGSSVLAVLAIPVAICALAWLAAFALDPSPLPWLSVPLLAGFIVIAIFSVGAFYLPSFVGLLAGCLISPTASSKPA